MALKKTANNKRDYSRFFAICKTHRFDYKDKVAEYTKGKTDSLRALTDDQFTDLMVMMIQINIGYRKDFIPKPGDKQRKKLIGIAKSMFWGKNTEETLVDLDRWIRKQKFKKPLMSHTPNELNLIIAIFEQRVEPDYLTAITK